MKAIKGIDLNSLLYILRMVVEIRKGKKHNLWQTQCFLYKEIINEYNKQHL